MIRDAEIAVRERVSDTRVPIYIFRTVEPPNRRAGLLAARRDRWHGAERRQSINSPALGHRLYIRLRNAWCRPWHARARAE